MGGDERDHEVVDRLVLIDTEGEAVSHTAAGEGENTAMDIDIEGDIILTDMDNWLMFVCHQTV